MRSWTLVNVCMIKFAIAPSLIRELILALLGSVVIMLLSQARIPLPFTPVPITLQTLGVLLVGLSFGSCRGASSVGLYIALGTMGMPAFAGGACGWKHLLGPTGGYLLGFVAAAWIVGRLAECGWDRNFALAFASAMIGTLVIYAFGAVWLSMFVGIKQVFVMGILPFIPGDIFKAMIVAAALPTAWKLLGMECIFGDECGASRVSKQRL